MSLDLNERQRAMLAEMNVHVWWPWASAEAAVPDVAATSLAPSSESATENVAPNAGQTSATGQNRTNPQTPVTAVAPKAEAAAGRARTPAKVATLATDPGPAELRPLPGGIAAMDWPTLRATVSGCQACTMCLGRRAPLLSAPPAGFQADWLVLGEPPDEAQERAGQPFVDEAGQLLDNMLKAVGVKRHQCAASEATAPGDAARTAYLSLVLKCRPALPTAPSAQAMLACSTYLRREIALVRPKVILAMGRLAMQVLLSEDHPHGLTLPLGKLRGQVWHFQGVPVVVTYPPAYLLRNGLDKAKAWADLCLAADVAQGQSRPTPEN